MHPRENILIQYLMFSRILILIFNIYLIVCVYVCVSVYICAQYVCSALRSEEVSDPLEPSYGWFWAIRGVLEVKPGSSARAATALNSWAISLTQNSDTSF